MTVQERARLYVATMPPAISGSGGHTATFKAAVALVKGFALGEADAWSILLEYNARCAPPWSERELRHKIASAAASPDDRPPGWLIGSGARDCAGPAPAPPPPFAGRDRPEFDSTALDRFSEPLRDIVDLVWLADRSAVDPSLVSPDDFLRALFPGKAERVIVLDDDRTQGVVWPTEPLPSRPGPRGVWFLVQPVDGQYHPNPRVGKMSRRSEESVIAWRYLLLESDRASSRRWLEAIAQLPLRVAAIYSSGGRSVHALVRVDARTRSEWNADRDALAPALVLLGADPAAMSGVRLSRLPGYRRPDRGRSQKLLYIEPDPDARAICEAPRRRDAVARAVDQIDRDNDIARRSLTYYAPVSRVCRDALTAIGEQGWERSETLARPPR